MRRPIVISGGLGAIARRSAAAPAPGPEIKVDRKRAASDTDGATRQTVEMMCDYIHSSAADPQLQAAARYAFDHFGMGVDTPAMKTWAVFWYVKHCVKFRQDEATMFRIGEQNQQDLLIAPAVLARMKDPAEDCDGFSMMEAAMLTALGVPVVIATVAVDPSEPERWSHVFPLAMLPDGAGQILPGIQLRGGVTPIDASHGIGPGWMVPLQQISRWQAWDLNGKPTDVRPSKFQGLHGYLRVGARMGAPRGGYRRVGMQGLGQDEWINPVSDTGSIDTSFTGQPIDFGPAPIPSAPINWGSLLNNLVSTAGSVARIATLPPGATVLPSGQVLSPGSNYAAISGSASPLLWVGLGVLVLVGVAMSKKGS